MHHMFPYGGNWGFECEDGTILFTNGSSKIHECVGNSQCIGRPHMMFSDGELVLWRSDGTKERVESGQG